MSVNSRTNPILISILLSILFPGLGQMYAGKGRKAIVFAAATILLYILLTQFFMASFIGVLVFLVLYIAFRIWVLVDAILSCSREKIEKKYNRWYIVVLVSAVFFIIQVFIPVEVILELSRYRTFVMPSVSMLNTIQPGDRFVIDTGFYKTRKPSRGDVIMIRDDLLISEFNKYPFFIKRCVALEGDTVEIKDNILYINDRKVTEPYAFFDTSITDSFTDLEENLDQVENYKQTIVPDNCYFLLGDNRYNSKDSRATGADSMRFLAGKALYIFFSSDPKRIGKQIE
jgi:signal peptidase I